MHPELTSKDIDIVAERITEAVLVLGAFSVLMMTVVVFFSG